MKTQYTTITVDDDAHALKTLRRYIEKIPQLKLTRSFEDPVAALAVLSGEEPPDIAFLDIDMPELSGLALAKLTGSRTEIVFTSAYGQYALDAFDLHVSGYLLKPFSFEAFHKTVQKVFSRIPAPVPLQAAGPLFFNASSKRRYFSITSGSILYLEAMSNYIKIYTSASEHPKVVYLSLKAAAAKLAGTQLIRVSRSFIVNLSHVEFLDGSTLLMAGGRKIRIGAAYRDAVQTQLNSRTLKNLSRRQKGT